MADSSDSPVSVPTLEELQAMVVPRRATPLSGVSAAVSVTSSVPPPPAPGGPKLSPDADALLRQAAQSHRRHWSLEQHWKELGVTSGSIKSRVLSELRAAGFIRAETKGREKHLYLYHKAYDFLGMKPPIGEGVGGATHKNVVAKVKKVLEHHGYSVYLEQEVGPHRKRVDLVAYGEKVVGVEVGLSDPRQELKNLRDDLAAGVLDFLMFVTTDPKISDKVRALAASDPVVAAQLVYVRFVCLTEDGDP